MHKLKYNHILIILAVLIFTALPIHILATDTFEDIINNKYFIKFVQQEADRDNAMAQFLLDMTQDYETAIQNVNEPVYQSLKDLAESGDAFNKTAFGILAYKKGKYEDAYKYLTQATDSGYIEAEYYLGMMYLEGYYVNEDYNKALTLIKIGTGDYFINILYSLGTEYYTGEGKNQNYEKAFKVFMSAAQKIDQHLENDDQFLSGKHAQAFVGIMYLLGRGVTQDYIQSKKWLLKAAEANIPIAQTGLGTIYFLGLDGSLDYKEALHWFEMAAASGQPDAQCFLGKMYCEGLGVTQNYEKGVGFYQKAAAQGDSTARKSLNPLYENRLITKSEP